MGANDEAGSAAFEVRKRAWERSNPKNSLSSIAQEGGSGRIVFTKKNQKKLEPLRHGKRIGR